MGPGTRYNAWVGPWQYHGALPRVHQSTIQCTSELSRPPTPPLQGYGARFAVWIPLLEQHAGVYISSNVLKISQMSINQSNVLNSEILSLIDFLTRPFDWNINT